MDNLSTTSLMSPHSQTPPAPPGFWNWYTRQASHPSLDHRFGRPVAHRRHRNGSFGALRCGAQVPLPAAMRRSHTEWVAPVGRSDAPPVPQSQRLGKTHRPVRRGIVLSTCGVWTMRPTWFRGFASSMPIGRMGSSDAQAYVSPRIARILGSYGTFSTSATIAEPAPGCAGLNR